MKPTLFIIALFTLSMGCTKENQLATSENPIQVRFQDIITSCTWNLVTLNNETIFDFHQTRRDSFLHSDINQFEIAQELEFGDTITIEYEVLEITPDGYVAPFNICDRETGIVIKILNIIE